MGFSIRRENENEEGAGVSFADLRGWEGVHGATRFHMAEPEGTWRPGRKARVVPLGAVPLRPPCAQDHRTG